MALNTNQSSINQMIQSINVAVDVYLDCFALCCRLRCRCFSTWTQIYWMTRGWTTWTTSSCPTLSFHPRTRKLNTRVNRSCQRMPPREEFCDLHGGRGGEGRVWPGIVSPTLPQIPGDNCYVDKWKKNCISRTDQVLFHHIFIVFIKRKI